MGWCRLGQCEADTAQCSVLSAFCFLWELPGRLLQIFGDTRAVRALTPCRSEPARDEPESAANIQNARIIALKTRESGMKTAAQLLKLKAAQNRQVHSITPEAMVLDALKIMAEKNVGALPVIEAGQVVGVISERDYARKVVLQGRSSVGTPVRAIMSSPVVTADSQQSIDRCMEVMTDSHLRHLPVLDNGQLIGLLSIGDLVKEAIVEQADLIRQLEHYIRGH